MDTVTGPTYVDDLKLGVHTLTNNPNYRDYTLIPPTFPDKPTKSRQWTLLFENGYSVSVISGQYAYCSINHPYELGLLHGESLCEIPECMEGDIVRGYLDDQALEHLLDQIAQLPRNDNCSHRRHDAN